MGYEVILKLLNFGYSCLLLFPSKWATSMRVCALSIIELYVLLALSKSGVFIRSRNFSLLHPTENLSDRPVTHSTFFLCNHNVFVFWVDLHIRKADRRFGLDVSGGHFKDSRRHSRGADTRACNLSVLTPYHPDRNGIPPFENYYIDASN